VASSILVAIRVAATPERTFDAFVGEIGAWWRPNGLFDFTVGQHGILAFEPGLDGSLTETYSDGSVFEIGRITTWEPPSRLAFTWRQASFSSEMGTSVEVRFEPVGAETRVTVEHFGWESVPSEHAAKHGFPSEFFLQRHAEYWRALLRSLQSTAIERQETI
jgi:uncharacterized protein YndB with AHSA1/START domain